MNMANEVIKRENINKAVQIDFVNKFGNSVGKLLEMLGVQRKLPMTIGQTIKTYKAKVTKKDGKVAEGEVIPLSKVELLDGDIYELEYEKWRKQVSLEAIQRSGYQRAVVDTDNLLLKDVQRDVRKKLFDFLGQGTGVASGKGLQGAFAKAWGQIQVLFEDDGAETIVFVNPLDIADAIEKGNLSIQTAFGLNYIVGFTGIKVAVVSSLIPQGTVYATAPENLVCAYPVISGGEIGKAGFGFVSDETGLIGVTHDVVNNNTTVETVVMSGLVLFAERLDGVVKVTIEADATPAPAKA